MGYNSIVAMSQSHSLLMRITASAAQEGKPNPSNWALNNQWAIISTEGWAEAWAYATDTLNANQNPDIGARDDVISDEMILSAVQPLP